MRNKLAAISLALVGLLAVSVPLFAHHGYAAYDTDKKVTLKGTVTRLDLVQSPLLASDGRNR